MESHKSFKTGPFELRLRAEALRLGFADVGIARADAAPLAGERLRQWLGEGAHGEMVWMDAAETVSGSPSGSLSLASTVIVTGVSSAVVALSLTATGGGLVTVIVKVCVVLALDGSRAVTTTL